MSAEDLIDAVMRIVKTVGHLAVYIQVNLYQSFRQYPSLTEVCSPSSRGERFGECALRDHVVYIQYGSATRSLRPASAYLVMSNYNGDTDIRAL